LLIIATGQYLGEGFDCPEIDTLFLAFPVSFKGKLVQYVGRAMRPYEGKTSVLVYDYKDSQVAILNRMHQRRRKTYRSLGFDQVTPAGADDPTLPVHSNPPTTGTIT
ncbi:MAG: DEAD/DEAH box helicase, partial [Gemmatimonadales bacterium]